MLLHRFRSVTVSFDTDRGVHDAQGGPILLASRKVTVLPGRDRLRGDVEVDESILGEREPNVRGRGSPKQLLLAGAIEQSPGHFGRVRLGVISDTSSETLSSSFLAANVDPGSHVTTVDDRSIQRQPVTVTNTVPPQSQPRAGRHTKYSHAFTGSSPS